MSLALHLVPALAAGLLLVDLVGGVIGFVIAFAVLLIAPGWLLWKVMRAPFSNEPLALPALWFVLSFMVLTPAVGGMTLLGWRPLVVEAYALGILLVLGAAASLRSVPILEWHRPDYWVGATAAAAMIYSAVTWNITRDNVTYLGFIRVLAGGEAFPSSNPFLSGAVPLAPRFELTGWTGLTGVLAHLGDVDPAVLFVDALPVLLVLVAGSAAYLLGAALTRDRRFSRALALAAFLIPLITSTSGDTQFKFMYKDIVFDKYAGMVIFLPAIAALLIDAHRSRSRSRGVVASAALVSLLFVHAIPAMLLALAFAAYVLLDLAVNRPRSWLRDAALSFLLIVPVAIGSLGLSIGSERFGSGLRDVDDLSEVAYLARSIGPIDIWAPTVDLDLQDAGPDDAGEYFVERQAQQIYGPPKIAFLALWLPFAHPGHLWDPANLIAAFAVIVIVLGRHRSPPALWILAASAVALSVFLIPPFTALVARFTPPWLLWRFSWLIPVPFAAAWLISSWLPGTRWQRPMGIAIGATLGLVFAWSAHGVLLRTEPPASQVRLETRVEELGGFEGVLLAPSDISKLAAARWDDLDVISYRGPRTMANAFPSDDLDDALERMQDSRWFFKSQATTGEQREILDDYAVDYVVIDEGRLGRFDLDALGLESVKDIGGSLTLYEREAGG